MDLRHLKTYQDVYFLFHPIQRQGRKKSCKIVRIYSFRHFLPFYRVIIETGWVIPDAGNEITTTFINCSVLIANPILKWLGHSDFSTTANIYAHLDFQSKISSAEAMLTGLGMSWRITSSLLNNEKILTKPILSGFLLYGGELGIRTLGGFTLTAFRVLSVEHHFEENKGRTEKLREDKNTNNSSIFRLFSVKNRGVSRVRMNHANLLKNGHFGEI